MVERAKAAWLGWIISGIPAAAVLIGCVISIGRQLNTIQASVDQVKTLTADVQGLKLEVQSLQLQVQELKDELQYEKKINELEGPKHRVNYSQDSDSVTRIPYIPPR